MNKSIKIIIRILIVIVVIWIIIFAIDYNRCSNMKEPIFAISKQKNDLSIKALTYQGLGYKVEVEKNVTNEEEQITKVEMYMFNKFITGAITDINVMDTYPTQIKTTKIQREMDYKAKIENLPQDYNLVNAIKDQCVISIHGTNLYNKDELDRFLENVDNNIPDFIRCISFTTEGNMLITDVEFEGNNSFKICLDWTRDEWSSKEDRTYKYGKFGKLVTDETEESIGIYLEEPIEGDLKEIYITSYRKDAHIISNYEFNYLLEIKESDKKESQKITVDKLAIKYDYDIYYYGIENCNIQINDEKIDLKEALLTDKVTMEEIIEQAEKDSKAEVIASDMVKDGGTMIYFYDTYTIIKSYSLDGNRDVYIGIPEMRFNMVR